jgi:hypothetical protein
MICASVRLEFSSCGPVTPPLAERETTKPSGLIIGSTRTRTRWSRLRMRGLAA